MSRIHEAMQRAHGGAQERAGLERPAATAPGGEHETFPGESVERRRIEATPPPPPSPPVPPAMAETSSMATTTGEPLTFKRVDARYAGKIVVDEDISAESREQYRRLAASLHHAQAAAGIKVVMLSSALMGEGKTLTSSNLALTLSESYHKQVLLIDADLRRPTLHSLFRIRAGAGLSEGLMHPTSEHRIPVHQVSSRLAILTAGRPTSNPIAGLTSLRMRQLLEEARGTFDWVIVDTPPVALLPDANLLSAMVDGAVLVVRAESTPWDLVQRAAGAIGHERLLGVVLNGATAEAGAGYYGYDYYSVPQPTTTPST